MIYLNILLWLLQIFLAIINAQHGWRHLTWSPEVEARLQQRGIRSLNLSMGFHTFLGWAELLAALGLILPGATGIMPWLTPLAAAGFALIMAGAIVFHVRRSETSTLLNSIGIFLMTAFVAYMRWQVIPL